MELLDDPIVLRRIAARETLVLSHGDWSPRNVLADGLLSQLVQADADNAALIERLHSYEPIEVPE